MTIAADESIAAFRECAAGFCDWCEGEPPASSADRRAAVWLARLHAAALALPETPAANAEGLPELPRADLARAERKLAPFSGHFYRTVLDPDPASTEEPGIGDLHDDLLDVYRDVKAGCVLHDRGQVADALWHWSFLHRIHWGRHAVDALAALHAALQARPGDHAAGGSIDQQSRSEGPPC